LETRRPPHMLEDVVLPEVYIQRVAVQQLSKIS